MKDWIQTLGYMSRVCLLDTGITFRHHLQYTAIENFTHQATHVHADHGNCMAEVIASQDPKALGVAPRCSLYVGKVWSGRELVWPHYEAGLRWAIKIRADVVNLSLAIGTLSEEFRNLLQQLDAMNTIIVTADTPQPGLAKSPYVLNVGRVGGQQSAVKIRTVDSVNYRGANGQIRCIRGTSVSAATISGLAACAKAADPKISRLEFVKLLEEYSRHRT